MPSPTPLAPAERALALQIELTAILARGKGVERLLRGWHQRTGEGVAVFDRLGTPLGRSDDFTAAQLDEAREALRTRAPRLGETVRLDHEDAGSPLITPFAGNDTVRGFLARRAGNDPSADLAAPALRALLALEYERHWLMDEPARRHRDRQFTQLLELDDDADAVALLHGLDPHISTLRGLVIEARDETHAEVLIDDLAAMFSTPYVRHRGRLVECLTSSDPRQTLIDYGLSTPVGLGTPLAPVHAARSIRQARLALETSRRVGSPMEYRDGASHDFLLQVASPEYLEAFAEATLGAIERSRGGDALLDTLHVWLIERRSIEATAERMQVHRHTVRNRIHRIAQLTGHDLDSIDTQTELWLALKARGFERETALALASGR
ncbi:PucR family transcriptional regulator [Microbacterium sp. NPDC057944]|uniref:PucR family transcriptional regulator n=1 Tax=Microbacterium sp. NPDC057944 TaxID=3346286 RepID=UPI0036D8D7B6